MLGALLRLALLLDTGNQTLESETKLSQQFLPTREPEARYRVVISTLLHCKLLTHFTHQQEEPWPEDAVYYTTPEYFRTERDVDH